MEPEYRELDDREREILEALLEAEFPGGQEWREQLASMPVKQIIEDGTLSLRCDSGPPLPTKYLKLGTEGVCKDGDGGMIAILLHADKNGFLSMLEILKYDGTPILKPPSAAEMEIF